MVIFAVSGLAAILLTAPSASASGGNPVCIPESLRLLGTDGTSICLAIPAPSITPPFTAYAEQNGSQDNWCLFSQPRYGGFMLCVPAFSKVNAVATFASGRPC